MHPLDPRLLRLHPQDNVLTVISTLQPGDQVRVGEALVTVAARLALGHKVAACAISPGEKIVKYGVPIGSASAAIAPGEHVHTHNLQSDYLPTWLREDQDRLFSQHT